MKFYQFTEKLKKRRSNKFLAFGVPSFGGGTSNHSRKIFGRSRDRTRPVGSTAFRSPFSGNQRHITIFAMGELFNDAIFSFLDSFSGLKNYDFSYFDSGRIIRHINLN